MIAVKTRSSLVQEETGCPERRLRTQKISQVKSQEFQRSQQMTSLSCGWRVRDYKAPYGDLWARLTVTCEYRILTAVDTIRLKGEIRAAVKDSKQLFMVELKVLTHWQWEYAANTESTHGSPQAPSRPYYYSFLGR